MDGEATQTTDSEPSRPVSSLKSHFEGLQLQRPPSNPSLEPQKSPKFPKPPERFRPVTPVNTTRALVDPLRQDLQWSVTTDSRPEVKPATRFEREINGSPPRRTPQTPVSVLAQSSPPLGPSVTIHSPKSPPKGYFTQRERSSSPEKAVEVGSIREARDLASQHPSQESTRSSTPHLPSRERNTSQTGLREQKIPPAVNRADKPKIPAKPAPLVAQDWNTLNPNARKASDELRISPFSTPPSGDESPSPERSPNINAKAVSQRLDSVKTAGPGSGMLYRQQTLPTNLLSDRATDARFSGFTATPASTEHKDARMLGFASKATPSMAVEATVLPARTHTVSERPPSRDSRVPEPPPTRGSNRHVSDSVRRPSPARPIEQPVFEQQSVPRDARQLGFSKSATPRRDNSEERRPGLPPRRQDPQPPPRPAEEFKRLPARTVERLLPASSNDYLKPVRTDRSQSVAPTLSDAHFPPPPKRHTFTEVETTHEQKRKDWAELEDESDDPESIVQEPVSVRTDYPDASQTNRRPPYFRSGIQSLPTKMDPRVFDMCGPYLCTAGYVTRVFDISTGEPIMALNHGETVKVLSVAFKPPEDSKGEPQRFWIGNNIGELQEFDIATHTHVVSSLVHNKCEIVKILRYRKNFLTLDADGKLFVWPADESGNSNLRNSPISHHVQKGHTFSMVVRDHLWLATGRGIRVYKMTSDTNLSPATKPMTQLGTGDITSGAYSGREAGRAYFGHTDGKVTVYSTSDYTCVSIIKASDYKINGLAFVGDLLWTIYKTGKVYVYDTSVTPWKIMKDWPAHDGPASGLLLNPSSWTLQKLQVVTVGHDHHARFWDGMLEEDWLENTLQKSDTAYCSFREIRAAVVTWNAGAVSPFDVPGEFVANAIHAEDPPELIAFGFQEVVDLESRAVTAKSILGFGKKKDTMQLEQHQSKIYREWRDHLSKIVNGCTDLRYSYSELYTSSLIGLFQCIFIRQDERKKVSNVCGSDVKCGMKGHYGNKGALVTRFVLDDSSLCFVNCHLAAGQTHTSHRNNDIANIIEMDSLLAEQDRDIRSSLFIGGGDGRQILDHEICILGGDLNYRIDTMPRDTVINMIKRNDFSKLLERDQLLICRRRMTGFRLSPFTELPLPFAPTYKYDVGTDNYDTSEKRRVPAWCDRLLYRGTGRIKQIEYRRHEVRLSDHRPVSGIFKIRLKTIDPEKRARTLERCYSMFTEVKKQLLEQASFEYLVSSLGLKENEARRLLTGA